MKWTSGAIGGGQLGCFDLNSCHVVASFRAMPLDIKTWHAISNMATSMHFLLSELLEEIFLTDCPTFGRVSEGSQIIIHPQSFNWEWSVVAFILLSEGRRA